jgi:hypothetical protein
MWLLRVQLALLAVPVLVGALAWYLDRRPLSGALAWYLDRRPLDRAVTWYLDRRPLNHHSHRKTGDR